MAGLIEILILSSTLIYVSTESAEVIQCKCGGQYANNRPVRNCIDGICNTNETGNRCVTIYRSSNPKTIIGYDCVLWPRNSPSECATYDDGSRLCVDTFCQRSESRHEEECRIADTPDQADLGVQINVPGLNFMMTALRKVAQDKVSKMNISDQTLVQSGFSIDIRNIQFENFVAPVFSYVLKKPSSIWIMAKGGDFNVCANWKAHWNVASFISSSGNLCIWSPNQSGIDAGLRVTPLVINGKVQLEMDECKFEMPIDIKFKGSVLGSIANMANGMIREKIQKEMREQFCKLIGGSAEMMMKKIPRQIKMDENYGLNYVVRDIVIDEYGIRVHASVNATQN